MIALRSKAAMRLISHQLPLMGTITRDASPVQIKGWGPACYSACQATPPPPPCGGYLEEQKGAHRPSSAMPKLHRLPVLVLVELQGAHIYLPSVWDRLRPLLERFCQVRLDQPLQITKKGCMQDL